MVRRVTAALGRRVAAGDVEGLACLVALADHLDEVIQETVDGLRRDHGYTWADIGRVLDITRQGARQRWGQSDG